MRTEFHASCLIYWKNNEFFGPKRATLSGQIVTKIEKYPQNKIIETFTAYYSHEFFHEINIFV